MRRTKSSLIKILPSQAHVSTSDPPRSLPHDLARTLRWRDSGDISETGEGDTATVGGDSVSGQTVARYLDLLVDLLLVRRVQPCLVNVGKRLVRAPKVYVRDSGLVHALLGLTSVDDVLGHPVAGGSYEGYALEEIADASGVAPMFYRTAAGAEIDVVLDLPANERWVIEIKRSRAPVLSRGFHIGATDLKATRRIVVHSGEQAFPMAGGVEALPLAALVTELRGRRRF